jgi:hypothetical protein
MVHEKAQASSSSQRKTAACPTNSIVRSTKRKISRLSDDCMNKETGLIETEHPAIFTNKHQPLIMSPLSIASDNASALPTSTYAAASIDDTARFDRDSSKLSTENSVEPSLTGFVTYDTPKKLTAPAARLKRDLVKLACRYNCWYSDRLFLPEKDEVFAEYLKRVQKKFVSGVIIEYCRIGYSEGIVIKYVKELRNGKSLESDLGKLWRQMSRIVWEITSTTAYIETVTSMPTAHVNDVSDLKHGIPIRSALVSVSEAQSVLVSASHSKVRDSDSGRWNRQVNLLTSRIHRHVVHIIYS